MSTLPCRTFPRKIAIRFASQTCRQQQFQAAHRRHFKYTPHSRDGVVDPAPPPPPAGIAALPSRRLIAIAGVDAPKFLNGLITSHVPQPDDKDMGQIARYVGFLSAQGRVLHDVFIYPNWVGVAVGGENSGGGVSEDVKSGNSFLIEACASSVDRLLKHIKRFKLRSKFGVRLVPEDECSTYHVWNDLGTDGQATALLSSLSKNGHITSPLKTMLLQDARAPGMGYRLLSTTQNSLQSLSPEFNLEQCDEAAYRVRRYLRGVAEGQSEILEDKALPHESNMDIMGGIDFKKGCYVGQELTIRTHHRGVVRKRILPVAIYSAGEVESSAMTPAPQSLEYNPTPETAVPAEEIATPISIGRSGRKGRSAGTWLGGTGNIGLALCRLDVMTDVQLPGEHPSAYSPEKEFVIQVGGEDYAVDKTENAGSPLEPERVVKLKAFVPPWLRPGIETVER